MKRLIPMLRGAAAAALVCSAEFAQAADGVCQPGTRVRDRQGQTGTVVRASGNDCYVKPDGAAADAKPRYYLAWMLESAGGGTGGGQGLRAPGQSGKGSPAGAAAGGAASAGPLEIGRYDCWTAGGGLSGTIRLEITGPASYSGNGKPGAYTYDTTTRTIAFTSGPWDGFYGGRLGPGKIGITSRKGGSYNTTCDRK